MSDPDERTSILARLSTTDLATLRRFDRLLSGHAPTPAGAGRSDYLAFLQPVADSDVTGLRNSEKSYGNSWKQRGGVDTYHMLRRKWERIEVRVASDIPSGESAPGASPYDIFEHVAADDRADGFIDDIRDLRRYLLLGEAEIAARAQDNAADSGRGYLDQLRPVAQSDIQEIEEKEIAYGDSWRRSGGIGAFMMLARKWDRIKQRVELHIPPQADAPGAARENVLEHIVADRRAEGLLGDIRDLRRFLLLVEAHMAARGAVQIGTARDDLDGA